MDFHRESRGFGIVRALSCKAKIISSLFCVPANVIKLIGLTRPPFLSPTNLITFAGTQNGEYRVD